MFFLGTTEIDTEPFCDPAVLQVVSASRHVGCVAVSEWLIGGVGGHVGTV